MVRCLIEDGVDIAVGTTSAAAAIAILPVAKEHKKILIVEPAVADQITGDKWNRYIFRAARNSTQDAISSALAIGKRGVRVTTLAQDYAFGRDGKRPDVDAGNGALAALPQRRVDRVERPRAGAQFTLGELVERAVCCSENLMQLICIVVDVDEAGGYLVGDASAF